MKDIKWYFNRLKAMKPRELIWRVRQKQLQKREKKAYYTLHSPVYAIPLPRKLEQLHLDIEKLSIQWSNTEWTAFTGLDLFGAFDYEDYQTAWNAGFQTQGTWPEEPYSPSISISQRAEIGDIRTNWELNRHFQISALAKSYYCTRDEGTLWELERLFQDWNRHNLFLHGVEWSSAMEAAIRVNAWVYAFAFLKKAGCEERLLAQLEHGVLLMTDHIMQHRARFSSANNHLIVEMYAVGLVGILTDYQPWRDEALRILTQELPRQNYSDGVNREMSLHYQSFVMEAYGLLWLLMTKNDIEVPQIWKSYLRAMTQFLADSTDDFGTTMEFGDSDEGKILDLNGKMDNHYQYVMNLMGCLLGMKFTQAPWHENLYWIVPEKRRKSAAAYTPGLVCSRREGGYTFLRSKDRRVLIGIDHAELGFGSIAAHGHADALSFQMSIDGQPVFVDAGTFNYHVPVEARDAFRSTRSHNTVMIDAQEQSEMLGPFIWGKRAQAELLSLWEEDGAVCVSMSCCGHSGIHRRTMVFNQKNRLEILDETEGREGKLFLHTGAGCGVEKNQNTAVIRVEGKQITCANDANAWVSEQGWYSEKYNQKTESTVLSTAIHGSCNTIVEWEG